ncbi:set domain-containing protein 5 [Diplodia corticola]|uniref:Set domain-containing protein 5 n=1 Tax=Diplodia corticola TaxID=236234 RepID=A0A1J9RY49_9PEZI|nr:set domain-containing protein 5 [Diplodia corticola]OJD33271.1 set domain-containing protein 5 [Diplodia corticola]
MSTPQPNPDDPPTTTTTTATTINTPTTPLTPTTSTSTSTPTSTTYTHPSIRLAPIPGRGLGTLATRPIPRGTRLVADRPLLAATNTQMLNAELFAHGLTAAHATLSADGRRQIAELAAREDVVGDWMEFWRLEEVVDRVAGAGAGEGAWAGAWGGVGGGVGSREDEGTETAATTSVEEKAHLMAAWSANCFGVGEGESAGGWAGVIAARAARFNHSCVPNAGFAWNDALGAITVHAIREVEEGEELTVAYGDSTRRGAKRREALKRVYGFDCDCVACAGDEEELDGMRRRIKALKTELARRADGEQEISSELVEEGVRLHERAGLVGSPLVNFYQCAFAATADRRYLEEELRHCIYWQGDDHPHVKELMERLASV